MPTNQSVIETQKLLQSEGIQFALLLTFESGRQVVEKIMHGTISITRIEADCIKYYRGNPDPLVRVQLLERRLPDWKLNCIYYSVLECLRDYGKHDFETEDSSWETKCFQCGIYEDDYRRSYGITGK